MTKLGLMASVLASLLLILAACGGGDDDDDASEGDDDDAPALTENELAEAILIELDDLPGAGWVAEPQGGDDEPNPLDECDRGDPEGTIGKAESDQFARTETESIEASSRIVETEEQLEAATEDFQEIADCVEELVGDGALDNDDALYSDFEFDEVDFAEFGDVSRAYRISMLLTEANPPEGEDAETADIFLDMVYIGVETAGVRLLATGIFEPYNGEELEEISGIAEDKIRAGLAGEAPDDDDANDDEDATDEPEESDGPTATGPGFSLGTPAPTVATTGPGSSPEEAIAYGDSGVLLDRMQIRVLEVDFDAEAEVLAFNSFNEATPGKNMVVVSVEVTNVGEDPLDVFFDPFWNLVGEKGTPYDEFTPSCGVVPDEIDGELQTGDSKTGNVCVQADEDDSDLVFYVEMYTDDFDIVPLYLALQ